MKKLLIAVLVFITVLGAYAQDDIKVMTYNILNYGNITSYCTNSNNSMADKQPHFKSIMAYYQPDILGVNELSNNSFLHQLVLDSVMNASGPKQYAKGNYSNEAGGSITNTLYFNSDKFELKSQDVLNDVVRDIILYQLYYKSPDLSATQDTAFLYVLITHLKAGSTSSDKQTRNLMVTNAMQELSSNYPVGDYIFMGDFNMKSSSEQAYQSLINYSNSSYRFYDPINTPGSWNNSYSYADVHTQSTHSSSNGCASGGGMDDRFDLILTSNSIINGSNHYTYVNNSYQTPGNDGNHFNSSINSGSNSSAPANIINSLYLLSDHLPVMLELEVDQTGAGIAKNKSLKLITQNPFDNELNLFLVSEKSLDIEIKLFSSGLHNVYSKNKTIKRGENKVSLQTPHLAKGFYILQIINKDFTISRKLIKI